MGSGRSNGCFNKTALHHTEQKKLEIWLETSSLSASKSTSARSETMENGHRIRPIYVCEDFSLWSILENEACSKPHQSIEALKKSLVKAWNAIPQEVIDRAVGDFPKRLKKCIDAQGGNLENK
uniref:HMG box domain-containing protein n=1 Tax=Acrobeloides nanus TaxID=290746 RepID=A0A914C8W4_9BILA